MGVAESHAENELPPGSCFLSVQALRAVAALLVVLYHASELWDARRPGRARREVDQRCGGRRYLFCHQRICEAISCAVWLIGLAGGGFFFCIAR